MQCSLNNIVDFTNRIRGGIDKMEPTITDNWRN